jgi:hypothetical protein
LIPRKLKELDEINTMQGMKKEFSKVAEILKKI